jgi:hypothetical protein
MSPILQLSIIVTGLKLGTVWEYGSRCRFFLLNPDPYPDYRLELFGKD